MPRLCQERESLAMSSDFERVTAFESGRAAGKIEAEADIEQAKELLAIAERVIGKHEQTILGLRTKYTDLLAAVRYEANGKEKP
mgnify:CR=1 FL=1